MDCHLGEESEQVDEQFLLDPELIKNIRLWFQDIFPYYRLRSAVTCIILVELLVYLYVPVPYKTIRSYYRFSADMRSVLGWLLCPFTVSSFVALCLHITFLLAVGSELEYKFIEY